MHYMSGIDYLRQTELEAAVTERDKLRGLLEEWFAWWLEDDSVAVKLPHSLHVRTALALEFSGALAPDHEHTDDRCCGRHGHHVEPHRGCVLR